MQVIKRLKDAANGRGTQASRHMRAQQVARKAVEKIYGGAKWKPKVRRRLAARGSVPIVFNQITPSVSPL